MWESVWDTVGLHDSYNGSPSLNKKTEYGARDHWNKVKLFDIPGLTGIRKVMRRGRQI